MFGKSKEVTAAKVQIKLLQGLVGHKTREVPASKKTVRSNETDQLVEVIVPAHVAVIGEFAFEKGDVTSWDAIEAKRMAEKGICEIMAPA